MGLLGRWWSYTKEDAPLWKVFWLFWALPYFTINCAAFLLFLLFHPHVLDLTQMQIFHATLGFRHLLSLCLLPLNILGIIYIYKARSRCQWMYFSILGLLVIFFSVAQNIMAVIAML